MPDTCAGLESPLLGPITVGKLRATWFAMMVAILLFGLGALVATAIAGGMLNLLFVTVFRTRA